MQNTPQNCLKHSNISGSFFITMVKCTFLSLLKICQSTRVELRSPSLSFNKWLFSFTNEMYQFIQLVHEQDLSLVQSQTQKQIGQWRAYSFKTFNKSHAPSHLILKAIGWRIISSLAGWNSPQSKQQFESMDYVNENDSFTFKDLFKKNDSFTNVTSLFFSKHFDVYSMYFTNIFTLFFH